MKCHARVKAAQSCLQWKEEDVVVAGFLKTGTTWLQEILWTMRNNPNLDHPLANTPILDRVPIIE